MHSKSPEKRGKQKVVRPPTYRIENEYNPEAIPQYFQISVNVLDSRKLVFVNRHSANSYVIVVLGKKKHRTSIQRNKQDPFYREVLILVQPEDKRDFLLHQDFLFELCTSIRDLKQSSLWLAVMEPRCCASPRLLGEANIDLGAIWTQPHHQVYHKWAQLCLPRDQISRPAGFLQIDVSILLKGESYAIPALIRDDKLESNLLLPSGSEQQCANYLITIYGALGLPTGLQSQGDKRFGKPPTTFVRVSFCGLVAKTATLHRSNNPVYSERISMVEMFPNMSQCVRFEVCLAEGCFNRVLACAYLNLGQISHDGENGFLPTFGPSLVHMYGTSCSGTFGLTGEDGPYHRGALLVAFNVIVPFYQRAFRSITVEPVHPLKPEWMTEDFCIFCPIFEVSLLDRRLAGKFCGVAITMGELPCENKADEEFSNVMSEIRTRKMHYTGSMEVFRNEPVYGHLEFSNTFSVLQLAVRVPDFRFRMYRNNMIHGIVADLNLTISKVKRRLKDFDYSSPIELMEEMYKALDDASGNIIKFLDIIQYSNSNIGGSGNNTLGQYSTELDLKLLALQREEIGKIQQQISYNFKFASAMSLLPSLGSRAHESKLVPKKTVKYYLMELQTLAQNLESLIHKVFEGWSDIVVWLLNDGSRVAYTKISAADIIYSVIPEQSGKDCGRIQNIFLKPLKCPRHTNTLATGCHCITGKLELMMWMGLHRHRSAFESSLPSGYHIKLNGYDMRIKATAMILECRAFIYKAKITSDYNDINSMQTFVRINLLNMVKETNKVKCSTLSPVWNQVLKMNKMVYMTPERVVISPPIVLVEVNNTDLSGKSELIGRFQIPPAIDNKQDYESAPKLQWHNFYKGVECTGQVLMSVQLLQIPERVLRTTVYGSVEECFSSPSVFKEVDVSNDVENLPNNLLPISTSYKVDLYWWGLRDLNVTNKPGVVLEIEEVSVKSELITNTQSNCNFPDGRTSFIFEAPLNESYSPVLDVKLFDSSSFGRTLYLGTKTVKNLKKYIVNWVPKAEREASLRRASIMSSDFIQVNQMLFIKKSFQSLRPDNESNTSIKKSFKCNEKCMKWHSLFCHREPEEEEYALLPTFATKKQKFVTKMANYEEMDWWFKYLRSDKDYYDEENIPSTEKFVIYDTELESQPEFSKFKDWCSSLKLCNGKKTGIQDKDELCCGILKAGIAIYKWPPPANTVAVTDSGVDLNKGFFDDRPSNDPAKFLIRVYIVKGTDLKTKNYIGKSDPYVVISCGKKHLGERYSYVANTVNPVFGRMYEFRCNLPEEYLLTVSLYNYGETYPDELVGCTSIDLEDRIYTKHRARVGLSSEFSLIEKYKWRDCVKPSAILEEICMANHLPSPIFSNNATVVINGVEYKHTEKEKSISSAFECKENLCLSILHNWHTLPICGYHLVPDHVETRTLYNPQRPGTDQGKVHMWIDIFSLDTEGYVPPPIDITPKKVEEYELRLTVYSVRANVFQANSSSRKIVDFYVRACLGSMEQAQRTDVHYKCINGESNFNWRMIFNFQYQPTLRKMVRQEKGVFTEYEENIPPVLLIQLMDNEATDNYLGSLTLNLNTLPKGVKQASECTLGVSENLKQINLFSARTLRAWWPLSTIDQHSGTTLLVGVIDLEITLLPQENAILMPVGIGREPPFKLSEPMRSAARSYRFNSFMNMFQDIPQYVWVAAVCIFLLFIFFFLTILNVG